LKWQLLDIPDDPSRAFTAIRLNSLGSLYFFIKFTLRRARLSDDLHQPICSSLEREHAEFLIEMPRDHFKTTIVSEGLPMWWCLPFNDIDEAQMRELGYDDDWIRWMRYVHDPGVRTITISESAGNAFKIGMRIDKHFESNSVFRTTFPEILPDTRCTWNSESKHIKAGGFHAHGEGTFDYIGVGGALQSRHYDRAIEDDLVGRDAIKSEIVMSDTIDYHRLMEGAFDGPRHSRIVTGNRWSPNDLNGWIRENQLDFEIESHAAYGGCCPQHPDGTPIFPEEFSVERLEKIRRDQGPYLFSHQYLNMPVMKEDCVFEKDWLRFYGPVPHPTIPNRINLRHEVKEGESIPDIPAFYLHRTMIVDPNHAGESGRANHAIIVTGLDPESNRCYLLDVWAESMSYDHLMAKVYKMAFQWELRQFWLETIAAQKYLKYHIEYRNKVEGRTLKVNTLQSERSRNAKRTRIESLDALFREGRFFCRRDQSSFLNEYYSYPGSRTIDVLDCLSYAPQTWNSVYARGIMQYAHERREAMRSRQTVTGY
jgi:Terminase RNaseH-like domain